MSIMKYRKSPEKIKCVKQLVKNDNKTNDIGWKCELVKLIENLQMDARTLIKSEINFKCAKC